MRVGMLDAAACIGTAIVLLFAPEAAAAGAQDPNLIQFHYMWGTSIIGSAQVWMWSATNLTRNVTVLEPNGTQVEEITDFHVHIQNPGPDPYPPENGTDRYPYPMITVWYDTTYTLRSPNDCIWVNDTVGLVCDVPRSTYTHQVLEMRFVRLVEFSDSNGDGAYAPGEPAQSQVDLSSRGMQYSMPYVAGLDASGGLVSLPILFHVNEPCCGETWAGWVGVKDASFPSIDGLLMRLSATGILNVTVTAYEWFQARQFQGVNLTTSQVKLDLRIEDYPFMAQNSRLALDINLTSFSVGSATLWEVLPWPEGQGLGMEAASTTAIFAWSETADADSVSVPVASSQTATDAFSRHLFLAYPRASAIEHDPVFGIMDKRLGQGVLGPLPVPPIWTWIAFGATLAVGSAVIYAMERRKRLKSL